MYYKITFIVLLFTALLPNSVLSQNILKGKVYKQESNKKEVLPFANIYWLGTTKGTSTDVDGKFSLNKINNKNKLVISFVGLSNDTITIKKNQEYIEAILEVSNILDVVEIRERKDNQYISRLDPIKTEVITTAGLQKLACCNLSESFESNATIDVGYTDAVSGAKQIQMLGLAGVYCQLLFENQPSIRGLLTPYGLSYIPGTWMESIQISKGTSSVINGYESITGQINIEFLKPEKSDFLKLNLYGNSAGKGEVNVINAYKLSDKWSTMVLAHGSMLNNIIDNNGDTFLDIPMSKQINVFNRWKYNGNKVKSQFGIQIMDDRKDGGQVGFFNNEENSEFYGINIDSKKYQAYGKLGYVFDRPSTSIGFMTTLTNYSQNSIFGNNLYDSEQNSIYANLIFESYLSCPSTHKISTGVSYMNDDYIENYNDTSFVRNEIVPGIFGQYTYNYLNVLNVIVGLRGDINNIYGTFISPRTHIRYELNESTTIRGSAGKGYRTVNVFAENTGFLASSRQLIFNEELDAEEAWNYGVNISKIFKIKGNKKLTVTADFYRTDFKNQVIVDMDQFTDKVIFYNLNGDSYSNSFQTDVTIEPIEHFEITGAYRFNDVRTTINQDFIEKPFVIKHKGLLTASYYTKFEKWKFDFTTQFNGKSRLPNTKGNPIEYQRDDYSKSYVMLHAQVTKKFKYFDVYIGGENLLNFKQKNPIIAFDDPFGKYFDTSAVWGPLHGRMFYAGLRYNITKI